MAHQAALAEVHYGAFELQRLYHKHLAIGFHSGVAFILLIISVNFCIIRPDLSDTANAGKGTNIPTKLEPPPPLDPKPYFPSSVLLVDKKVLIDGIPKPVPNSSVPNDQTILTQDERNKVLNREIHPENAGGGSMAGTEILIDENPDPLPDTFQCVEKIPVPIIQVAPKYPDLAIRASLEGEVFVKALINKEGTVKKAFIIKSSNEVFNDAVLEVVVKWKFTPAMMTNGPVPAWTVIPFKFHLCNRIY